MSKFNNSIVFDSVPLISDKLLTILNPFFDHTEVHSTICKDKIHLYNTADLILIPSYMIRTVEALTIIKAINKLSHKVIITPVPMTSFEIAELSPIKNHNVILLSELQQQLEIPISDNVTKEQVFNLKPMIDLGLLEVEAIETANLAMPKLKQQLTSLINNHRELSLEPLIEQLHSIHGMTNYCGLINSKDKINALELNLKETKDAQLEINEVQLSKLASILNLAKNHLKLAEESLAINQVT